MDHAPYRLREQGLLALFVLHEVQAEHVVEVGVNLLLVVKVEIVVQLGELEHDLDGLRLVITGKAAVLSSLENSVAALEDQVRANWVLPSIETLVETLLLGKQDDRAVLLLPASLLPGLLDGSLDVAPNIRRVVPI